jgi:signal transduction histidine kinase
MSHSEEIKKLVAFFRIDQADLDLLAEMREVLEESADDLVEEFYRHLLRFPETQELLRDERVRNRLLKSQREYLLSLADPVMDAGYMEQRVKIGSTHERVGLDTRWYLGAYALYASLMLPIVHQALSHDPLKMERAIVALQKRLMLDAEIAIRQYIDRREADLRLLNEELRAAGVSLRREVAETSLDLQRTQERARVAEELASVATLISGLAHEVGTPMGVIRGHAEALETSVEGERAQWRLSIILEQIDRITGIIHSLLNMARPRAAQRVELDLPLVMETTVGFLTEKLKHRQVTVDSRTQAHPALKGDPERLQQVFLNLLINAIDAMPDGGELRVVIDQENDDAVIRIHDSGAGIPADQLDQIFDPFFTTKPAGRGNGLGLVVVKGIVDEHGGTIDVSAVEGEGTEFVIRLPVEG